MNEYVSSGLEISVLITEGAMSDRLLKLEHAVYNEYHGMNDVSPGNE